MYIFVFYCFLLDVSKDKLIGVSLISRFLIIILISTDENQITVYLFGTQ